jgi:2-oxoglutarate ferredoxin oxidoreductase subunit gamma
MSKLTQIRLCGYGGQGVVLAGMILGHAAIYDDQWVAGSNSYGAQARGGAAKSEVVLANHPITYPHVLQADILIAMSQTAYDQYIENVAEQGAVVIYDDMIVHPRDIPGEQQIGVSATKLSIDEFDNKQVANIVMLGASAAITKIVSKKSLTLSIKTNVADRFRELNIKALHAGFALAETVNTTNSRPTRLSESDGGQAIKPINRNGR